jgi:hypothetical protein
MPIGSTRPDMTQRGPPSQRSMRGRRKEVLLTPTPPSTAPRNGDLRRQKMYPVKADHEITGRTADYVPLRGTNAAVTLPPP